MMTRKARLLRSARVKAGAAKFRAHQLLAATSVPAYRRLRSFDEPLSERYLFVLAHPRSGSTVLSHVLQSHTDIAGFGEHHETYRSATDLTSLAARNAFHIRAPLSTHRYTLDKVVWNQHEIHPTLLARPDLRFVFLVREPVATLKSYRRMFKAMTTDEHRLSAYCTRLEGLTDIAKQIGDPDRMAFITYDDLIDDTEAVLARVTTLLDLDTPLAQEYEVNAKSGSQSYGDPSENIKAGTIIKVEHDSEAPCLDLDALDEAHRTYRATCEKLAALTTSSTAEPLRAAGPRPAREPE